jgi:hypothetical protein
LSFDFDPGPAASAAFVGGIQSFGNQAFEAKLLRDPEQFIFAAPELIGEPNVFRRPLEKIAQQFAPGRERLSAQIFPFQKEDIPLVPERSGGSPSA